MLNLLRAKLTGGAQRIAGKTDLLEGGAAMTVLTAMADGDLTDTEAETALERLLGHDTLSAAFKPAQIEAAFDKQAQRARKGLSGKLALKREIDDLTSKATDEDREMMLAISLDVAMADGDISAPERKVLDEMAKRLGLGSVDRFLE